LITLSVLAGGKSDRMGQDKALKLFLGKPLIMHVIERLRPFANQILLVVNHQETYGFLNLPLYADLIPGYGPLGGIHISLSKTHDDLVAVVGCDMPFVSLPLFEYERDIMLTKDVDVVIPSTPNGLEPLLAIYRRDSCLPFITSAMEAGEHKIISWFNKANIHVLSPELTAVYSPQYLSFKNLNTPEEFASAEQTSGGIRLKLPKYERRKT
jgi:molybdopterin-guanine dinucleotide biosynthesis protein A